MGQPKPSHSSLQPVVLPITPARGCFNSFCCNSPTPAGLSATAAAPAAAGGANTSVDIDSYAGASLTDKLAAATAENQ